MTADNNKEPMFTNDMDWLNEVFFKQQDTSMDWTASSDEVYASKEPLNMNILQGNEEIGMH